MGVGAEEGTGVHLLVLVCVSAVMLQQRHVGEKTCLCGVSQTQVGVGNAAEAGVHLLMVVWVPR